MRRMVLTAVMLTVSAVFSGVVEQTYNIDLKQLISEKSDDGYDIIRLGRTLNTAPPGEKVFKWTYLKDGSASAGDDCARLDNIFFPGLNLTSIDEDTIVPETALLYQNYPNPFNPETVISYSIPGRGHVRLSIFNVRGEEVAELYNGYGIRGEHRVLFSGEKLNSGLYFCRMTFEGRDSGMTRMLLIK